MEKLKTESFDIVTDGRIKWNSNNRENGLGFSTTTGRGEIRASS